MKGLAPLTVVAAGDLSSVVMTAVMGPVMERTATLTQQAACHTAIWGEGGGLEGDEDDTRPASQQHDLGSLFPQL